MSHVLPFDCVTAVLACIPLQEFVEYKFVPRIWKLRFLYRYGELIDDIKTYLVRAATEHYEICTPTRSHLQQFVVYYYTAKGKNWDLLLKFILEEQREYRKGMDYGELMGGYNIDIFLLACKDNTVSSHKCVERMLDVVSHVLPRNVDFISSNELCQIFYRYYQTYSFLQPLPQMLRLLPLAEFKTVIQANAKHVKGFNRFYDIGSYQKDRPDKVELKQKIEYYEQTYKHGIGLWYKLYHNMESDADCIDAITWLSDNNMKSGDLSLLGGGPSEDDFDDLKHNFARIPDAMSRAGNVITILERAALDNQILYEYIGIIRLLTNTLTSENMHLVLGVPFIVAKMLEKHSYDLILAFDSQRLKDYELDGYVFEEVEELNCMLRCKHIILRNCIFFKILTMPLYNQIQENNEISSVVKNEFDRQWQYLTLSKNQW